MREKTLRLLGLMRRANAISVGETNTGGTVRAGKAKLLILAQDSSDNARRRAEGFTRGRNVLTVTVPFTKEEIASNVGLPGCSMAAITDIGFANAFMKSLAEAVPGCYDEQLAEVQQRFAKADKRKKEAAAHEKNKRIGKRRNDV